MASELAQQAIVKGGSGMWPSIFLILRIAFWSWIIILFFLTSIIKGIEARDPTITLYDLGNRFLLVSNNLDTQSLSIINNGFSYTGLWNTFSIVSDFFSAFIVIYLWICLFVFILNIFFKSRKSTFTIYLYSITIFIVLQIFASLINAGINGELMSWTSGNTSALYFILLPFSAIIHFFQAIYLIIKPIILSFN